MAEVERPRASARRKTIRRHEPRAYDSGSVLSWIRDGLLGKRPSQHPRSCCDTGEPEDQRPSAPRITPQTSKRYPSYRSGARDKGQGREYVVGQNRLDGETAGGTTGADGEAERQRRRRWRYIGQCQGRGRGKPLWKGRCLSGQSTGGGFCQRGATRGGKGGAQDIRRSAC